MLNNQNSLPTAEGAARRLLVLKFVVLSALAAPPRGMLREMTRKWKANECQQFCQQAEVRNEQFWKKLREVGLSHFMSPCEQTHSQSTMATMSEQQQANAFWRLESVQILMWALGMMAELPAYDIKANPDLLKQFPSCGVDEFIQKAQLRNQAEIGRARDIAESWHWRSRTRELIERGEPFPDDANMKAAGFHDYDDIVRVSARNWAQEGMIPPCIDGDFAARGKAYRELNQEEWEMVRSVTFERHFALNWLCGYAPDNKWDETPTGT